MKNKQRKELAVCGFSAVKALEKLNPQAITRLYFTSDKAPLFGGLCKKLASKKIPYNQVQSSKDLEKLCGSLHHQGVVAMIEQPSIPPVDNDVIQNWIEKKEKIVFLDRVGNANNLGAIVRSAAFFGVKNIVIPADESQSSITTSSYRVAQGGMEYVNIYYVDSTIDFLQSLKDKIVIFGTDVNTKESIDNIPSLSKKDSEVLPSLVILGNEESGISEEVKSCCDYLVTIPGVISDRTLDSLNVAQAAAVIFYQWTK